jgi:hypothetical protein
VPEAAKQFIRDQSQTKKERGRSKNYSFGEGNVEYTRKTSGSWTCQNCNYHHDHKLDTEAKENIAQDLRKSVSPDLESMLRKIRKKEIAKHRKSQNGKMSMMELNDFRDQIKQPDSVNDNIPFM